MSDEIRTAADLRASIVDQRGGIERFDGPQRRLLDALVFELAKKPNEIDVRVVTDLTAMLPRPVSAPTSEREDREAREAMIAPLLKLYRYLHESVHTLSAENAQLRARLGLSVSTAVTPREADETRVDDKPTLASQGIDPTEVVPPSEWRGVPPMPGPDDPKPPVTIEGSSRVERHRSGVANQAPAAPPAAPAAKPAWENWVDAELAGAHYSDPWSNRNA